MNVIAITLYVKGEILSKNAMGERWGNNLPEIRFLTAWGTGGGNSLKESQYSTARLNSSPFVSYEYCYCCLWFAVAYTWVSLSNNLLIPTDPDSRPPVVQLISIYPGTGNPSSRPPSSGSVNPGKLPGRSTGPRSSDH